MAKKAEDSLTRVEKHLIRPSSPWFSMIAEFCHLAKNLYNHGNYLVRNRFLKDEHWTRYDELDEILKLSPDEQKKHFRTSEEVFAELGIEDERSEEEKEAERMAWYREDLFTKLQVYQAVKRYWEGLRA